MEYQHVLYEVSKGVATISINRPQVHNAFTLRTLDEISDAFKRAEFDREVGVIVLTGTGGKAFCSGGDVNMENESDSRGAHQLSRRTIDLSMLMRSCGKPTIAAVRGWCIGGGNELNLLCDLTIATEESKFGQVGPTMGSVPIWWATQLLPSLVGDKRAKEIVMLCQRYTAKEAESMGWVNKVVPDAELETAVRAWCDRLLEMSPQALRVAKLSLNHESDQRWPSVLHGFQMISFIHETEEFHEGTKAFLEKRKPNFAQYRK